MGSTSKTPITAEAVYAEARSLSDAQQRAAKAVSDAIDMAVNLLYAAVHAAAQAQMATERIDAIRKAAYEAASAQKA